MRYEESQLVGGRPADVARLAAAAGLGLFDRTLERYDDVAERRACARRQREGRGAAATSVPGAGMARKRVGREKRERQDVGRARFVEVRLVELGEDRVVGKRQGDRGR